MPVCFLLPVICDALVIWMCIAGHELSWRGIDDASLRCCAEACQLCTLHMCMQEPKGTPAEGWHDTLQHTGHRQQRMLARLLLLKQGP